MQTTALTAESVLQHHLEALGNNDLEELMKDYSEDSELWTPDAAIEGAEAISAFFSYAFTLLPQGSSTLEIKMRIAKGDKIYIVWTADSPIVSISFATDCFEIKEGKIVWQSTAYQMAHK